MIVNSPAITDGKDSILDSLVVRSISAVVALAFVVFQLLLVNEMSGFDGTAQVAEAIFGLYFSVVLFFAAVLGAVRTPEFGLLINIGSLLFSITAYLLGGSGLLVLLIIISGLGSVYYSIRVFDT